MKNTNKQNPLKTFNDNYAARAKKVVEGNKKLVKAQVGLTNIQGPVSESAAWTDMWTKYRNNQGKTETKEEEQSRKWSIDKDRKSLDCVDNYCGIPAGTFKKSKEQFRPTSYENIKKSGGQTKSKKK